ncbi:Retinoic acid induced 16-like protein-domain-containing protein [Halteromyces radiatus]|uniref:Retinoic acid induced 16-like protein-domain-containing protein n=1 Tax=Halteromyces radiatus TaxID=101107 RepID=UPI0022203FD1|nr:Retinoic acid induced 16-like protein-domain-containing protein [Halteromyces radiatus]KAI8093806.1 Retinoic acid induced 16-like protein-domain-containing protein [Halteromyces radiatus]
MSMFLSKFLSGRNNSKSKLELLVQSWLSIQKYYETAADALKDAVDLTPIPTALQNIVKLIQAEELEYERVNDTLETGPCLEYLLQRRVLEELVEFAKVDTPYGMRIHCLRFFCSLVINVHAQLLPERAVHVPLQKLITSCHRLIAHHYEQLELDPEACSEERHAAIAELSLELVKLMHGVFAHFKGTNAALMDLFFERGWCRGLGENVWRSSKDGKTSHKRRESLDEKIHWNMFLMPRFDMFTHLIDFMNIPGETGEIAREAILFALRLLEGDPEYVCYIVEYSGLCEVMAERLALLFALLPKNMGAFTIASNNRVVPVRPPRRRIQFSIPAMITNNSLMITVNAHNSCRRKRRKKSPFDTNFIRTLENTQDGEILVDSFYSFWEYLNDVARVADKRLMTALMAQLTTNLWHPVVCTALSSPSIDSATAATAYTTEMIRSLTDQTLLHAFLVVLVGEEGGVGKDLDPEIKPTSTGRIKALHGLDDDDDDEDEDDDTSTDKSRQSTDSMDDDDLTLRVLLIHRLDAEDIDLSLATLRLFDTMLETYNQFVIYNLVLRNYVDIGPDGEYVSIPAPNTTEEETPSIASTLSDDSKISMDDTTLVRDTKENKTDKVRWLVERVLSLLPLEDELERMKSPSLSTMMSRDGSGNGRQQYHSNDHSSSSNNSIGSNGSQQHVVVPGNSYDDYFHEARERFQYGMLARNFWQFPYPPVKNRQDIERETEDRKGRPKRPKSMVVGREAARMMNDTMTFSASSTTIFGSQGKNNDDSDDVIKRCSSYEGLFLHQLFDLFAKMLESTMEQNLMVTSILQKIAGIVDRRVDGVICDWRAIRVGEDGNMYGGVWTLPTTTSRTRRSLYALLEQVTFEALKRAQLVPNFETRIALAKKRGVIPNQQQQHQQPIQQVLKSTALHLTASHSTPRESTTLQGLSKQPSFSHLVFNKQNAPLPSPPSPTPSKSANTPTTSTADISSETKNTSSSLRLDLSSTTLLQNNELPSATSPSSLFFQQKSNATPVTMTNPFAKLSNFVHAYIVLQEFCKELAAVVLVRHATAYPDEPSRNNNNNDTIALMTRQKMMAAWHQEQYYVPQPFGPQQEIIDRKWKQRMSVATTYDWRHSLDPIDEMTRRPPSSLRSPI